MARSVAGEACFSEAISLSISRWSWTSWPMASATRGSTARITSRAARKAVDSVDRGCCSDMAASGLRGLKRSRITVRPRRTALGHSQAAPRWSVPSQRASHGLSASLPGTWNGPGAASTMRATASRPGQGPGASKPGRCRASEQRVGQAVDLVGVRGPAVEHHLVGTDTGVGVGGLADLPRCGEQAGLHVRDVAAEGVVVAEVAAGPVHGVVGAESDVRLGDQAGAAGALVLLPGRLRGPEEVGHEGGRQCGAEETVAEAADAFEGSGGEAAEQHLRTAGGGGGGADGADALAVGLAGPGAAQQGHLFVEAAASTVEVGAGGQAVVLAASDTDAEGEAAAGEAVEGRGLLREQGGVVERRDQHLGLDADAGRGTGEGGKGDEGLGVVVDEAVEQAESAEGARVGAPGPGEQLGGVVDGEAEADVHGRVLRRAYEIRRSAGSGAAPPW